jgi:hypothetical protein
MTKITYNGRRRNDHFLIIIYHSSLVKGAMNAARLCKLRNGVKKRLNFFYFQWEKVDQVHSEYLRSYLNWLHNWQLKSTRRSYTLKGLSIDATIPLKKSYRMSLISAGSISLDSALKHFILLKFCVNFKKDSWRYFNLPLPIYYGFRLTYKLITRFLILLKWKRIRAGYLT